MKLKVTGLSGIQFGTMQSLTKLALVFHSLDSAIHRLKIYPVDSAIYLFNGFPNTYPLDSDLSGG